MFQLRGQIHFPNFYSTPIRTLWFWPTFHTRSFYHWGSIWKGSDVLPVIGSNSRQDGFTSIFTYCFLMGKGIEEGRWQVKFSLNICSFYFPARSFCRYIIQNSAVGNLSPKTEGTKTKAARCLFFWCLFPSCTFWILCNLLLLFTFAKFVCLLKRLQRLKQ